jgi:Kef-type K+ transport system membrane component KefB
LDNVGTLLIGARDTLGENLVFALGALLLGGFVLGKLVEFCRLPRISGYIIAGLVLGDAVTGFVPHEMHHVLATITEFALGLIALTIGREFHLDKLRSLGAKMLTITVVQLLGTFGVVCAALVVAGMELPFAMLLGAIASATAPAATVAIIESLGVKGRFVDYVYGVVALDDAGCLLLFSITGAISVGFFQPGGIAAALWIGIPHALAEIGLSLLLGAVCGVVLHWVTNRMKEGTEIEILALGFVMSTIALSEILHLSPLLTLMTMGVILTNTSDHSERVFRLLDPFIPPILLLFFVIAGTELRPEVFTHSTALLLGIVYVASRGAGKYGGVFIGALASRTRPQIRNYLGLCMFPQAGVAIGLVLLLETVLPMEAMTGAQLSTVETMVDVVLFSVFINELVGPVVARAAILRGIRFSE